MIIKIRDLNILAEKPTYLNFQSNCCDDMTYKKLSKYVCNIDNSILFNSISHLTKYVVSIPLNLWHTEALITQIKTNQFVSSDIFHCSLRLIFFFIKFHKHISSNILIGIYSNEIRYWMLEFSVTLRCYHVIKTLSNKFINISFHKAHNFQLLWND